jgi:hypothetical protein
MKNPFLPPTVPVEKKVEDLFKPPENLPATVEREAIEAEVLTDDFDLTVTDPGFLESILERIPLHFKTKRNLKRAEFINSATAIISAMRDSQHEKQRLQTHTQLHDAIYQADLAEQAYRLWSIEQKKTVERAENDAKIADAEKKAEMRRRPRGRPNPREQRGNSGS